MLMNLRALLICLSLTVAASPASALQDAARNVPQELLEDIATAYRDAHGVTDTVEIQQGRGDQLRRVAEGTVVLGTEGATIMSVAGLTLIARDGNGFVTSKAADQKYVQCAYEGDGGFDTLRDVLDGFPFRFPHIELRLGDGVDHWLPAFGAGVLRKPEFEAVEQTTVDGQTRTRMTFTAENGNVAALIDPESHFIESMSFRILEPGQPEENTVRAKFLFDRTETPDAVVEPSFSPAARRRVSTVADLKSNLISVGEAAPEFTLRSLDGATVSLSDLRGNIVILDFWATWCVPCKQGLPLLNEYARWADEENLPVRVLAVDVRETKGVEAVREYWNAQDFIFPTLLDSDDQMDRAYAINDIPLSVVIGPEGRVVEVHSGFDADMVNRLQEVTRQALESD